MSKEERRFKNAGMSLRAAALNEPAMPVIKVGDIVYWKNTGMLRHKVIAFHRMRDGVYARCQGLADGLSADYLVSSLTLAPHEAPQEQAGVTVEERLAELERDCEKADALLTLRVRVVNLGLQWSKERYELQADRDRLVAENMLLSRTLGKHQKWLNEAWEEMNRLRDGTLAPSDMGVTISENAGVRETAVKAERDRLARELAEKQRYILELERAISPLRAALETYTSDKGWRLVWQIEPDERTNKQRWVWMQTEIPPWEVAADALAAAQEPEKEET